MSDEQNRDERGSEGDVAAAGTPASSVLPRGRREWIEFLFRFQSLFGLIAVFIAAIALSPQRGGQILFLTPINLTNILLATADIGIIAVGMTFVILIGGIDLSVGSVFGLASTGIAALLVNSGYGALAAVAIVLSIGLIFGAAQGFISTSLGIQAFIVTLAGLQVARGIARIWSGGTDIPLAYGEGTEQVPPIFSVLGERVLNGIIPVPAIIFVVVGVVAIFVLNKTTFARHVYAIGGNERAARLSGVPIMRVKVIVFAISGFLAALAGIVNAGQLNQGSPNAGIAYELEAIAAVVIGGTSLMGGVGSVVGTLAGAVLLGILSNILALNNVDSNVQLLVTGAVIVLAAALQAVRSKIS